MPAATSTSRSRSRRRARKPRRCSPTPRRAASWSAPGISASFERPALLAREHLDDDRRRRPHRELLLVPHGAPHHHRRRPGQGHPAARRLPAGRAAPRSARAAGRADPDQGLDVRPSGDVYALLRLGRLHRHRCWSRSAAAPSSSTSTSSAPTARCAPTTSPDVTQLIGPGTGPGVLFTPYRRAWQTLTGATSGFTRLILRGTSSYPGLTTLDRPFYDSIRARQRCRSRRSRSSTRSTSASGSAPGSIAVEATAEAVGADTGSAKTAAVWRRPMRPKRGRARHRRHRAARQAGRRGAPPCRLSPSARHPARAAALGAGARRRVRRRRSARGARCRTVFAGVTTSCTAPPRPPAARTSTSATRSPRPGTCIEAAAAAGVQDVIQVSSLAVLKPGHAVAGRRTDAARRRQPRARPLRLGQGRIRGSGAAAGRELGLQVKVIRPGPLVDYAHFHAPGRLGRELGPYFVAIGGRRTPLSVLDVGTAARVIRSYVDDFAAAPQLVNLVEAPPRREASWSIVCAAIVRISKCSGFRPGFFGCCQDR